MTRKSARVSPPNSLVFAESLLDSLKIYPVLLGGNQRDQDRLKAQKKLANQNKPKESAASLAKRKEA